LLNGAALYPLDIRNEGLTYLATWLNEEKITIYQSSANVFRYFLDSLTGTEQFPELRLIALGSTPLTKEDVESYKERFSPTCILLNRLSTTEARTIRWHFVDKETQINEGTLPVGYAVEDKEILLLNESDVEVGPNEIGEIAVRSRYLSPGYWRRPDLTQAAFLPDSKGEGKRIYRTGDLGRMQQDGCLEHLGRKDFQVKIRGFTVETAEVERAFLEHPNIRQAAITTEEDNLGDKRLVAYLVTNQQTPPSISELRGFLTKKVPDYMVPAKFVLCDALPLTASGKVDRQALSLPDLARLQIGRAFMAPRTPVEEELAKIWAEVLSLDQVGIHDNFLDLGGHSLAATRVVSRVIDRFKVELPIKSLFESVTVADMAAVIMQNQAVAAGPEDLARMLAEIEALSDREAERLLADESMENRKL
jgi:acyl-coenzyme A synthetase/AMP-(fatty) acid ligase/acyl carrier protein